MQRRFLIAVRILLGVLMVGSASSEARGQEAAAIAPVDSIAAFVKAHAAIASLRDKAQAELAEPKNKKGEEQLRIRDRLREQVAAALRDAGLTQVQYESFTHLVSTNDSVRKVFEEHLAKQGAKPAEERER